MQPTILQIRSAAGVVSVVLALAACASLKSQDQTSRKARSDILTAQDLSLRKARNDIHERLSAVIARDGFSHGLRSERDGSQDFDSVYIHVALDSLKRRHYTLDNLMKDIGTICALPSYAHLAIRIEIAAGDEEDRMYLKNLLVPAVAGKANITVVTDQDLYNDIVITIRHPEGG